MAEKKNNILLVDDDEDFLFQQKVGLESEGFNIFTASAVDEAKEVLEGNSIDCAVLDIMMEDMDSGFVLAHHIKKNHKDLPVILLTAVTGETGLSFGSVDEKEKKWVKSDVVLAKPVRVEQLAQEIKGLIS